jgi:coenzyme F420 biosynthesis associated uncharacterized protein
MAAGMIDWDLAEKVGGFVAGDPPGGTRLAGDLDALAADARERVVAYTGLKPAREIPAPEAVGRKAWLEGNLASMRRLLAPLDAKLEQSGDGGPFGGPLRALGGALAGAEMGALVGYLGQRVLGQYELVLIDAASPERLLFVAPNLREAAVKLEVDEADLVAWVAYHEVTHAVQFTSVPWLREHLGGLLARLLESVDLEIDPSSLLRLPSGDDLKELVERVKEGGLVTLAAGPERKALLDEIQATMAVVEGHAEHVMDVVGADALDSLDELRVALDRRREEKPPAVRLLERLIGLELKMRQYRLGKTFCDAVVAEGGIEALNRAWSHPAALPTLAELEAPGRWLERTASASG